jgi:Putative DNA-binding domain
MMAPCTHPAAAFAPPTARAAIGRAADALAACHAESAVDAVDLLIQHFPVVRRRVGDESFRLMARRYMFSALARASIRLDYGDTFPQILRTQGTAASLEYVADIAELEMVRGKARRSADARPLSLRAIASLGWDSSRSSALFSIPRCFWSRRDSPCDHLGEQPM